MERYVGQIQTWSSHTGHRVIRGAIYDSSKRRSDVGDMAHDFKFIKFVDPDELEDKLAKLNR